MLVGSWDLEVRRGDEPASSGHWCPSHPSKKSFCSLSRVWCVLDELDADGLYFLGGCKRFGTEPSRCALEDEYAQS